MFSRLRFNMTTRPTIAELVPHYMAYNFDKPMAVYLIIKYRLQSNLSEGNGNRARRRAKQLEKARIRRENAWTRHIIRRPLSEYEQLGNHQARKEYQENQLIG